MTGTGDINVMTTSLSGASTAAALPGGMTEDNTTIGSQVPKPGTFTTVTSNAGDSSATFQSSGLLNAQYTPVSNEGAGDLTLMAYSLPANSLTIGKVVRITAFGTSANNANSKTIGIYVGGDGVVQSGLIQNIENQWEVNLILICTGSNTQRYFAKAGKANAAGDADVVVRTTGALALVDTAAIYLECSGLQTASDDITQDGMIVEFLN